MIEPTIYLQVIYSRKMTIEPKRPMSTLPFDIAVTRPTLWWFEFAVITAKYTNMFAQKFTIPQR